MVQNNIENDVKTKKVKGIGIDILWILVVISGFLFFTSLIPLPPNDFWWHLKIGDLIHITHSIPSTNMFAWSVPENQPFYYAAWLAELLFSWFYKLGKLELLIALRTLLIGIAIGAVAYEARRRANSWRIAALVTALLCLMITNNLPVRTQMWAWIPFVTTYLVLKRFTEGKLSIYWLLLPPVAMIIWVNVHGSFILGLILSGAFFVGETASRLLKQSSSLSWQQIGFLGSSGILSSIAVLINPHFTGIINYTIKLMTDPPSQKLIEEWQSPTPQGFANTFFFLTIIVFIALLAFSKYRLTSSEIIITIGFLWLAWSGQRYVIWWGMITTPILAQLIKDLQIGIRGFIPQKNWLNLVLAIVIFLPVVAVLPWFVERMPLPGTYWKQVLRGSLAGPLLSVDTPVTAANYLNEHPIETLFNEMGYGSYLEWANPGQKVFIDSRVELFPYDQWLDYININNGVNYEALLKKYGINGILLDKNLQAGLMNQLMLNHQWTLAYEDQYSQVWTKMPPP